MQITHYHIKADFKKIAVVLADFHSSTKRRSKTDLENTLVTIEKIHPDFILSPGDVFNNADIASVREDYNINGYELLKGAGRTAPVYMSVGNHENGISDENKLLLKEAGVSVLNNEFVCCGEIVIGGLTSGLAGMQLRSGRTQKVPDLTMLDAFSQEKGFRILLSHHPEYWAEYVRGRGIDLTVSGHAHGGQWGFFGGYGVFAPGQGLFPKYVRGLHYFEKDGSREVLAVSRGMTNTEPIPRFFNPCEILVLHFGKDVNG